MASQKQLDISYFADKDILDIIIEQSPSVVGCTEHGHVLVHYDEKQRDRIVGLEILDFTDLVPRLHEPGVLPELSTRFEVVETEISVDPADGTVHRETRDTGLRNVTLREALEWAYHHYILSRLPAPFYARLERQPAPSVPAATPA